jgi:hypothetical protein
MYYLSFPLSPDAVSTSPPNSLGFVSTSASSTNSVLDNYEVEVVEIGVTGKDLDSRKEARYGLGSLVVALFPGQSG